MSFGWVILAAFLVGLVGTGWLRRYALNRDLLDIPNERSSHSRPTPRGGGLSVSLVTLAAVAGLGLNGDLPASVLVALFPALLLVGIIGWLDDHYQLRIVWRAGGYLLAAAWFVIVSGGLNVMTFGDSTLSLGAWHIPLWILALTWLTNLYNFMDGADAIAGLQAVSAALAGGILLHFEGAAGLSLLGFVPAAAGSGFLYWNRSPARIFMGDVGSCFLGFLFGALALLGERLAGLPALLWVILLGVFVWDATLTLLMRFLRGERWYQAHRCHAYQRLLRAGWSHGALANGFLLYNVLVLWPLAIWGYLQREHLWLAVLVSLLLSMSAWGVIQWRYTGNRGADS